MLIGSKKEELLAVKNWTQINVTILTIDMYNWLEDNMVNGEWASKLWYRENGYDSVFFKDPKMATYFLLKWSWS